MRGLTGPGFQPCPSHTTNRERPDVQSERRSWLRRVRLQRGVRTPCSRPTRKRRKRRAPTTPPPSSRRGVQPFFPVGDDVADAGVEGVFENQGEVIGDERWQLRALDEQFAGERGGALAVAHDQEVRLVFLLVAQVPQLEVAQPEVGPAFDRLEQVAGDEGFRPT